MSKITPSNRTADLGNDPVGRLLVRLALPTITAQIVNLLYNIVDRIYIGRIPLEGKLAHRAPRLPSEQGRRIAPNARSAPVPPRSGVLPPC